VRGFWWVLRRATGTGEGIVVGIEEGCWHGRDAKGGVMTWLAGSVNGVFCGSELAHEGVGESSAPVLFMPASS
jgi:hypothetical protein